MLVEVTGALPAHVIDLFARTSEVTISPDMEYAPHRFVSFLYGQDLDSFVRIMQLNSVSPFSFVRGASVRLFDRRLIGGLCD